MNTSLTSIYTAHYRYSGEDRVDITVKGQHPEWKLLAPTWGMVMGIKNDTMSEDEYIAKYLKMLDAVPISVWNKLFQMSTITLVCFCNKDAFCHRNILTNYICDSVCCIQYHGWRE
jgi:hypothetical protein